MSYPNERFLKSIYFATALFCTVLIVSLVVLTTVFPQWSLFPKAVLLSIMVIDVIALVLAFALRIRKRKKRIKML